MKERILNFSAGPAVLPEAVLKEAQRDLLALPGVGMSVLEISHRSKTFDEIITGCEADIRKLAKIPDNYRVLFLGGGASLQFSMVPMNMLPAGGKADYIVTGSWSKKAVKEAQKVGTVQIAGSTESENFSRVPEPSEIRIDPEAAYVHFTTNNTIFGTEWEKEPESGSVPLVADASSDIFSRPIEVSKYALLYAGAQKNLAPAGVTLVLVRDDMLARSPKNLPTMLDYNTHAKEKSLYNTPPVFPIYVMRLVMKWMLAEGGLEAIGRRNADKANLLYGAIDGSGGFYRAHARPGSRSNMNVTFRLPSEDLEKRFVSEATSQGLDGLKGHRSVGGIRASIYNAFPRQGVETLISFMKGFQAKNG
ncbi:MAG TPA: 3-phosphoserine/phosphohydroxythreonine transaminase [Thermoanaerobaculia bacterium]|jgi:phosphoserine aminotransferase|nr:3-phosphoserine/phosphohydroxythreonine transaminase [Thermoanaerobaculia bacterium]